MITMETYDNISASARASAREACAREVEAAGCVCETLDLNHWEVTVKWMTGRILQHDRRCPVALAAKLREGK